MPYRNRRQTKPYKKYIKTLGPGQCQFCEITSESEQFVEQTASFEVVRNIFPYTMWDEQGVSDHLLLLPKKHTDTLSDLTPEEAQEFVKLMSRYENKGYNVYARAPGSHIKSVYHQHTHLIKSDHRRLKTLFYFGRSHIRFMR